MARVERKVVAEDVGVPLRAPAGAEARQPRVASAVTDAVTAANTLVVGSAPALATAGLLISTSTALVSTATAASEVQHGGTTTLHASTVGAVDLLLGVSARRGLRTELLAALKRG